MNLSSKKDFFKCKTNLSPYWMTKDLQLDHYIVRNNLANILNTGEHLYVKCKITCDQVPLCKHKIATNV